MGKFDVQTKTNLDDRMTCATPNANHSKEFQLQDKADQSECVLRPTESKLSPRLTRIYTYTYPYLLITGGSILGFVPLLFFFIYISNTY